MNAATLNPSDPATWDAYISSAPTIVAAQDRMQEAATAGVDFAALLRFQSGRVSS